MAAMVHVTKAMLAHLISQTSLVHRSRHDQSHPLDHTLLRGVRKILISKLVFFSPLGDIVRRCLYLNFFFLD